MIFLRGIGIGSVVLVLLCMEYYDFHLVSAGEVRCVEREREALLRFKKDLVDRSGVLSSWGSKKECCKWKGVVCSNATAHVIALSLGFEFDDSDYPHFKPLGGKISDALLELHHLTNLDLSYNELDEDQFPEFIGSMYQLQHLNLRGCLLHGTVPPQLGNLTNLQSLDLSLNSFGSDNLDWLSHLSLLTRLDLSYSFNFSRTNWLQPVLKLHSLQELHLSFSSISGVIIPGAAPSANISFASLSTLDLSYNEFTSSTLDWLVNISTSLAKIDMSYNELDGPIPDVMGRFIFLEDLDLSDNMLDGELSSSLGNLSHLQTLSLSGNDFKGDLEELVGNISTKVMMSLESLDLSYNQMIGSLSLLDLKAFPALRNLYLGSKFTRSIPESLCEHSVLEALDVSCNSLEGTISAANFSKLHNLKVLDLSFNSLTLQIAQDWSPPFQLNDIRLAGCNMSPHFPKWIQTQRNVRGLDISSAGISDEVPKWLWSFSPALVRLNSSHNKISGVIPDLSSTSIDYLDVSSNKLSGHVPLLPQSIWTVQFSQNMFSGSISSICTALYVKLAFLDLSKNQLAGEIPNCWDKMSMLGYLNLGDNSFSGEIPHTLANLPMLNSLHLRGNNLSGELPSTSQNYTQLLFIDVGGNKLTGNIPAWIGVNEYLMYVILSRNKFYGSIPPEICLLTNIRVLDLSRNNISGKIPQCFKNFISLVEKNATTPRAAITFFPTLYEPLKQFQYAFVQWKGGEYEYRKNLQHLKLIDLSSNRLMGSIPASFSSLRELVSLNLSRNLLTGTIISDIGQMGMLEVLDLSRNQLSGEIPLSLGQLNFLAVLDLANNSLSGKIPTSTQLQSFNESVYVGNNELCGLPLRMCLGDVPISPSITNEEKIIKKDGGIIMSLSFMQGFCISMAFGFIVGFWGVVGSMLLKRSWRYAYFK